MALDETEEWHAREPQSLPDRIAWATSRWPGTITCSGLTTGEQEMPLVDLHGRANRWAAGLAERGIGLGSRVAVLGATSLELVTAIDALWATGAQVCVLPIPMRARSVAAVAVGAVEMARRIGAHLLLADGVFFPLIPEDSPVQVLMLTKVDEESTAMLASRWVAPIVGLDTPAVLQMTSGSAGTPKVVTLTHRMIDTNHRAIARAVDLVPGEVSVSWLPLYHDMGLLGFLALPLAGGVSHMVLASPETFVLSPRSWMESVASYGATVTGGPSFAFGLATAAMKKAGRSLDLSSLRVALNGAEPIDCANTEAFVAAASGSGMPTSAMQAVYGMAEATLLVTSPAAGTGFQIDEVDAEVLQRRQVAVAPSTGSSRRLAVLGDPVDGIALRVVDGSSEPVSHGNVGEIEIAGESVIDHYDGDQDGSARLDGGWFATGDRGYLTEAGIVICGRSKDIIIVGGRNLDPQEIEAAAERTEGVRRGNVIAFSLMDGGPREKVVVVAESREPSRELGREMARNIRAAVDVWPDDVVFVEPGRLPKTSSGKLRRAACRSSYVENEYDGEARPSRSRRSARLLPEGPQR